MKILTSILLFTFISPTFAQGIGTGGGKGPNSTSAYGACEEKETQVSLLEEEFVKKYNHKYKDEKDFYLILDGIIIDSTFHVLDKVQKHDCTEKELNSDSHVESLKEILKIYKEQKNRTPRCLQFNKRIYNIEKVDHVIKFYE